MSEAFIQLGHTLDDFNDEQEKNQKLNDVRRRINQHVGGVRIKELEVTRCILSVECSEKGLRNLALFLKEQDLGTPLPGRAPMKV